MKNPIKKKPVFGGGGGMLGQFGGQVVMTLLIFIVIVALYASIIEQRQETEEISISALAFDVSEGLVSSIVVRGDELTVTYVDGTERTSKKEADISLSETLNLYGVEREALQALEIEIKSQTGFAFWALNILPFLIPILFILIFFWFISRQVRGASMQAFSFGQSRARIIDPNDKNQKVTFKDVAGVKEAKEELLEIVDFLRNPKKFLEIGARIPKGVLMIGGPGTGKCIVGDSLVLTNKGVMEIKDIPTYYAVDEKDRVSGAVLPAIDVEQSINVSVPASHWYDLGEQKTHRLTLKNGLELEGTPEHPVLVMGDDGQLRFKHLSELTIGDSVAVSFNNQAFGRHKGVDVKTAYMMGLLTGDGNLSHASRVGFTTTDRELETVFTSFVQTYDESCKVSRASDGITQVATSWKIKKHLYDNGMSYLLSYDKVIPPAILQAPKEIVAGFLRGLFDSDGSFERYVVSYSTVSKKLSDQMMVLLLNFGIKPKRRIKMPVGYSHPRPVYEIIISGESLEVFRKEIGFGLGRKKERLDNYLTTHKIGNTNVDVFPYISNLVYACWQVMSQSGKSQETISKLVYKVKTRQRISRSSLGLFVKAFEESGCHHPDFDYLKRLLNLNLLFSPVVKTETGQARVYDFTVPKIHSFISNGIVSHNTLLARAVAGEAHVPFFYLSGSEFVEMFVGVGASRVRDLFKMAKKAAPAIIFIDEIDAIGRHRGSGMGGGNDEREQTLNQILVEMDGFEPNEKLIVMAATNRPDVLDPALLRPGRFDRRVVLDQPDIKDREEILNIHARKKPLTEEVDLRVIAERTPGFSGADLANVMNEAAILAARENRKKVSQYDFIRSVEKVMLGPERKSHILSAHEKKITAYHEIGHALVASVLPDCDPIHKVSIISRGHAAGYTLKLPFEDRKLNSRKEFLDDIAMSLGGYATEKMIFGDITTGASNDISVSTRLARSMVTRYGMSDKVGPVAYDVSEGKFMPVPENRPSASEAMQSLIDQEVANIMSEALRRANEVLVKHRKALEEMSAELMKVETLEREDFEKLLILHGIKPKQRQENSSQPTLGIDEEEK